MAPSAIRISDAGSDWPRSARWALWATILGIALYIALDVIAQLLPPHYNAISQAESDLGVGPYGWVMDLNFVVRGVLSLTFVYALYRVWPSASQRPNVGLALIGAWGVGAFILSFNTATISGPATTHGTIHNLTAALAFLFAAVGALLVSYAMNSTPPWGATRRYAWPLAIVSAVALLALSVGTSFPRIDAHYFGLLERVFLGFVLLWMLVISILLIRSSHRQTLRDATPH
ncbi:MAG: DUF998 domain-containing protein [Thermoplasmata archaeon]